MATSTPTSSGGAETANDADTDLSGRAQPRDEMVENVVAAAAAVELPANATRPEAALPRVRFSLSASSGTSVDVRVELIDASEVSDALRPSKQPASQRERAMDLPPRVRCQQAIMIRLSWRHGHGTPGVTGL